MIELTNGAIGVSRAEVDGAAIGDLIDHQLRHIGAAISLLEAETELLLAGHLANEVAGTMGNLLDLVEHLHQRIKRLTVDSPLDEVDALRANINAVNEVVALARNPSLTNLMGEMAALLRVRQLDPDRIAALRDYMSDTRARVRDDSSAAMRELDITEIRKSTIDPFVEY